MMAFVQVAVNGIQGSGKTAYCMYWMWAISRHYRAEGVRLIHTDDFDVAADEIRRMEPGGPRVIAICIDDAMANQSSYRSLALNDKVAKWYEVRHIAEEKLGDTGVIIVLMNWQRYNSVNTNFRNADLFAFFTPMSDEADADLIRRKVGQRGYDAIRLEYAERQVSAKRRSRVVVSLAGALDGDAAGWHEYKYVPDEDPEWAPPRLIRSAAYYAPPPPPPKPTREEALAKIAEDPARARDLEFFAAEERGEQRSATAERHGVTQSTVSRGIARIRKLLEGAGA
ncbi:MAG: LysR family transcriptional regulator [Candidatus Methanoplasma sp.]|jgi:hypothetical protein|nr:LysR family transcriptional regulator [Candidatus Methanoplasma sp.]